MQADYLPRRSTVVPVVAAAIILAVARPPTPAAMAQTPGAPAEIAAASAATSAELPAPSAPAAAPRCVGSAEQARFSLPLARVARRIVAGQKVRIVAIGSSSTYGAGASSSAASYPSRLEAELSRRLPGQEFTVLNRGVNGEEASDMIARFETAVLAEDPDLVLWQVGTNSLLHGRPLDPRASLLHMGLAILKSSRADIVLIDPQYAPKVIVKPNAERMVAVIAQTAKEEKVEVFGRFAMMRHWIEADDLPFASFMSADGLHMNDWSYDCLAKRLATAIAEAATRPTATASVPR